MSQELSEEEDETELHPEYRGVGKHHGDSLILDIIIQDVDDFGRRRYEACANVDFDLVVGKDEVNHDSGANRSFACKKQELVVGGEFRELKIAYDEAKKIDK